MILTSQYESRRFNGIPGWTHGADGAVWGVPDDARLLRAAGLVLARLPLRVSSCHGPVDHRPASCSGQRRTEWLAPEQTIGRMERGVTSK